MAASSAGPAGGLLQASGSDARQAVPLVVDLDGTLLKRDLLLESLAAMLKTRPLLVFLLPVWLARGKAWLKHEIALRSPLELTNLPWRTEVIEYLKSQRRGGRSLVLATGSDLLVAEKVARHLGLFDLVIASDHGINLSGEIKRQRLVKQFGLKAFDYAAGGGEDDLAVWPSARRAIVTSSNAARRRAVEQVAQVEDAFTRLPSSCGAILSVLRPMHWLKNLLVLVPGLLIHPLRDGELVRDSLPAFAAFCLCASAGYLLNDLLDLESDRHHPQKRHRPLAAGAFPLSHALIAMPALLLMGGLLGLLVSPLFFVILIGYFATSAVYSLYLKKAVLVDVLCLAGLYTLRIVAGSVAAGVWPSTWLVVFSVFLFFSLALVKRYGELVIMRRVDGAGAKARRYELSDGELLAAMGIASGYLAVLVLALHIAIDGPLLGYWRAEPLWVMCPLLLYWISHVWVTAHRGNMPGDPLVFAVTDHPSRVVLSLAVFSAVLAGRLGGTG
jgi:4-hydroxybenzoate polyprenyltransferase